MPSSHVQDAPSPSTSALRLSLGPLGRTSRRGSIASLSSRGPVDKEVLREALDQIHTSASRSETLTTFDQFASPPPPSIHESKGITGDLVQGGLSGLYNRFKTSVGRGKEHAAVPPSPTLGYESDGSVASSKANGKRKASKSVAGTTVSSPVLLSSPPSHVQSPLVNTFKEAGVLPPLSSENSSTSRASPSTPQSPLPLQAKSKPLASITPVEHAMGRTRNSSRSGSISEHHARRASQSTTSSQLERIAPPRSIPRSQPDQQPEQSRPSLASRMSEDDDSSVFGEDDMVLIDELPLHDTSSFAPRSEFSQGQPGPIVHSAPLTRKNSQTTQTNFARESKEALARQSNAGDAPSEATVKSNKPDTPTSAAGGPARPPMIQIGPSHLPGYRPSRASSSDGMSSLTTVAPAQPRHPSFQQPDDHHRSVSQTRQPDMRSSNSTLAQMKRRVLGKEFWMRDENAKDCFYCGEVFSTFRRKHHCRTCGQIFDAKCTSLVSGKVFGQSGNIRVCKPCEAIINGNEDDSSDYSEDADQSSLFESEAISRPLDRRGSMGTDASKGDASKGALGSHNVKARDHTKIGTPMMGIPTSRKPGEKRLRSAVIEFNAGQSALSRPSSSRSLRSLSMRPLSSSGHRRHHSRHQHMRSLKDERAPFHRHQTEELEKRSSLPAFHNDSIIDPDLAAFMSDEDSSEDDQPSIFATLSNETQETNESDRNGLGGLLSVIKKGKSRTGDRSIAAQLATPMRDFDTASISSRHVPRHNRRRNLSVSSLTHRPLPRRSKSNSLLKPFGINLASIVGGQSGTMSTLAQVSGSGSKMVRSASMRGEHAPAVELNRASLQHVRKLLRQMLQDANVAAASSWEKALMPILLRCTDDVNPDVQRSDDIDVRHYIKLKKIPGGRPGDTSYISGVVFSKNVALKSMPRSIPQPRVLIVTFPIEYARHQQHFMSLEPVIAQEREFLRNLVGRIAALNPQVLFVQRNVSGLALQYLEEANITVVHNVKPSVLNAVSRCLQIRMISSIDKLATDPSTLGQCQSFDVKTYVHGRVKKTYIYLSGCKKELGCTIVLRGADTGTLRKLKQITEFLCYVVYNLKLETCLMRDEFVLIPSSLEGVDNKPGKQAEELTAQGGQVAQPAALSELESTKDQKPTIQVHDESGEHVQADTGSSILTFEQSQSQSDIQQQFQQQDQPLEQTQDQANTINTSGSQELAIPADVPMPSFYGDMVEKHRTKILSASPFIKFMQPYLLTQAREQERRLAYLRRLRDQYGQIQDEEEEEQDSHENFELVQPEMVHTVVQKASRQVRDFLHAVHDAEYDKAMHNYLTQKRQWEAYLSANSDLFDPFTHQKIAVLYSVVNSITSTPCIGPEIISLEFYKEHDLDPGFAADCTLGQYVEDLCYTAGQICTANGCGKKMLDHHRHYIHGEGQMSVVVEKYPSKIRGLHNTMLMWSSCRICGQETQTIPMSESTWKYSFAKYLELTFWSTNLHPRADICPHDIHRNHVRYFGFSNYALRIQYDPIELYEVIVPRPTIAWKVDRDLRLKNEQFLKIEDRLDKFMASVKARIKSIRVDSVVPEKQEACKVEIANLMRRANEEQDFLRRKLQNKYMCSRYYEIIPLNRAIRAIHEKALAWDETFAKFEKAFFPSEKDIQRLAVLQLKKIFLDRDESQTSVNSIEEGIEEAPAVLDGGQTGEKDAEKITSPTPTGMSPEQTRDMLASVVEQHHNEKDAEKEEAGHETPHAMQEPEATAEIAAEPTQPAHTIDQSDAVEREEVRHLDLAVPADSPSSPKAQTPQSTQELQVPGMDLSRTSTASSSTIPHPAPLSRAVSDLVEQMRSGGDHHALDIPPESRIPRLVDMSKREPGSTLISRAQSSTGIVRMQQGTTNASSATVATSSTGKSDTSKPSLTESARALEERMSKRLGLGSLRPNKAGHSMIPRSVPSKPNNPKVSTLAKHFEQLSKEFERQRLRERHQRAVKSRQARAYPLASSKPIVEIYRDAADAVEEKESNEDLTSSLPLRLSADTSTLDESNYTATTTPTVESHSPVDRHHEEQPESSKRTDGGESVADTASLHHHSDAEGETSDVEHILEDIGIPDISDDSQILPPMDSSMDLSIDLPKHEKSFMMKMLNNFWSERSASGWMPLDYPFAPIEHVWEDSDIIVREDEPSSIIALALSNADYQGKLQEFRNEISEGGDVGSESTSNSEEANIEHNLRHKSNTNIKYVFQNRSVRATCKIFFAQSFDAMRRKCGVADRFVESMSRCLKWDSKGGKTKSLFLKTLDDRFVLKSLSQVEVNAFLKFAPDYFSFIHQNLFNNLPSVIAKMFGLFQVTIKNPASGRDFDCFMLVMENLFYDRGNDLRRFDLKGSMRNRKIQSTGEQDEVLLDENLVDIIFERPIFVREHTKKTLTLSVYNDTLFLSKQNVMDYSLMAGFNDSNREIVVGIIDCIRTYTWDKKLETWIKDRGKNKPTVTSPKDYRQRFRVAMSSYILQAPDFWHAFNTAVPSGGGPPAFQQHKQQQQIEGPSTNGEAGVEREGGQDGFSSGEMDRKIPEVPMEAEVEMGLGGMMAEGARGG